MSRLRGLPSPLPVPHSGYLDDGRRNSTWRPALRRIKRGLFPSREVEQDRSLQPVGPFPLAERDANAASRLPQDQTSLLTRRGSRLQKRQAEPSQFSQPRDRPRGPREPFDSKGFNLIKRTLSRSKKPAPSPPYEATNDAGIPPEGSIAQGIQMQRRQPQTQPHPQPQRRSAKEDDTTGEMRPRTAGYVPRYAGKDSAWSIQQNRPLHPPANLSRHTSSYTPTHAAADFSRINMMPAVDPALSNKFSHASVQFERPATADFPAHDPQLDSQDYQRFLAESRRPAARMGRSRTEKERHSEASKTMDDNATLQHARAVRERALSISQLSTASRRARPPSFVEKLGEYIKPTRPGSVYSQRSFFEGDDKISMKGSVETGQERWELRWARVGSSIRRSFSRDRDGEGDEMAGRDWAAPATENTGRRKRVMPVSLALKKYNRAIAGY